MSLRTAENRCEPLRTAENRGGLTLVPIGANSKSDPRAQCRQLTHTDTHTQTTCVVETVLRDPNIAINPSKFSLGTRVSGMTTCNHCGEDVFDDVNDNNMLVCNECGQFVLRVPDADPQRKSDDGTAIQHLLETEDKHEAVRDAMAVIQAATALCQNQTSTPFDSTLSQYENDRNQNVAENNAVLQALGIRKINSPNSTPTTKRRSVCTIVDCGPSRQSSRYLTKPTGYYTEVSESESRKREKTQEGDVSCPHNVEQLSIESDDESRDESINLATVTTEGCDKIKPRRYKNGDRKSQMIRMPRTDGKKGSRYFGSKPRDANDFEDSGDRLERQLQLITEFDFDDIAEKNAQKAMMEYVMIEHHARSGSVNRFGNVIKDGNLLKYPKYNGWLWSPHPDEMFTGKGCRKILIETDHMDRPWEGAGFETAADFLNPERGPIMEKMAREAAVDYYTLIATTTAKRNNNYSASKVKKLTNDYMRGFDTFVECRKWWVENGNLEKRKHSISVEERDEESDEQMEGGVEGEMEWEMEWEMEGEMEGCMEGGMEGGMEGDMEGDDFYVEEEGYSFVGNESYFEVE